MQRIGALLLVLAASPAAAQQSPRLSPEQHARLQVRADAEAGRPMLLLTSYPPNAPLTGHDTSVQQRRAGSYGKPFTRPGCGAAGRRGVGRAVWAWSRPTARR